MKILAVREQTVPLGAPMHNASVAFDTMTASALAIVTDRVVGGQRVAGLAFDSIGRYAKGGLLRERFLPRLQAAPVEAWIDKDGLPDPAAAVRILMTNEKDGGHGERAGAVGLVEAAVWDLRAKLERRPLWRSLADHPGAHAVHEPGVISVYGSCGHFRPGRGAAELQGLADEVRAACAQGHVIVKIKLGGQSLQEDLARVEAAISAAGSARVAVDVNGRLAPAVERAWVREMAALGVAWIEEPVTALDFERLRRLASFSDCPIATGENLFSFDDARNLLRYGGLRPDRDLIQVDISLSYGIGEYRRILDEFESAGWGRESFAPHAGHLFAAHTVAGLGLGLHEAATDLQAPFAGFWEGTALEGGRLLMPDANGVGFERKPALMAWLSPLLEH
ncbi:MAG: enolase C-terminal domain-like protein [Betaproteobacteria bacterium]